MGAKIEIFRVTFYVFFPVGLFYYFNIPGNQENYIEKRKKEIYPPREETNHPPTTVEGTRKYMEMMAEARKKAVASTQETSN